MKKYVVFCDGTKITVQADYLGIKGNSYIFGIGKGTQGIEDIAFFPVDKTIIFLIADQVKIEGIDFTQKDSR